MNKRIRELAEQAGLIAGKHDDLDFKKELTFKEKKFAELIIRECADIAYKTSWGDLVHGYGQAVIPLHLHNTIKEHFGVEE